MSLSYLWECESTGQDKNILFLLINYLVQLSNWMDFVLYQVFSYSQSTEMGHPISLLKSKTAECI